MASQRFLDIPTSRVIAFALGVVVFFLGVAWLLYWGHTDQFLLKVADTLINGAIVGILVAVLKALLDIKTTQIG
jgi:hypothetical protein